MKKRLKIALLIVFLVIVLIGFAFYAIGVFRPKTSGLLLETNPQSSVYINGNQVGRTPFSDDTLTPGEVVIKLIPDSFERPLIPYESSVRLGAGVETVIKRDFGETEEESGGEIISFEKTTKDETGIVVVSIPDSASVVIDGGVNAFTPYKTTAIVPGQHTINISYKGYLDKSISINTKEGYILTLIVDLVKSDQEIEEEEVVTEEEVEEEKVDKIKILDTPVGFLRVRDEPSTLGGEVGQVDPGDEFEVLETDEETGWFKIEFEEGSQGWVSNQYSELVDTDGEDSEDTLEETN